MDRLSADGKVTDTNTLPMKSIEKHAKDLLDAAFRRLPPMIAIETAHAHREAKVQQLQDIYETNVKTQAAEIGLQPNDWVALWFENDSVRMRIGDDQIGLLHSIPFGAICYTVQHKPTISPAECAQRTTPVTEEEHIACMQAILRGTCEECSALNPRVNANACTACGFAWHCLSHQHLHKIKHCEHLQNLKNKLCSRFGFGWWNTGKILLERYHGLFVYSYMEHQEQVGDAARIVRVVLTMMTQKQQILDLNQFFEYIVCNRVAENTTALATALLLGGCINWELQFLKGRSGLTLFERMLWSLGFDHQDATACGVMIQMAPLHLLKINKNETAFFKTARDVREHLCEHLSEHHEDGFITRALVRRYQRDYEDLDIASAIESLSDARDFSLIQRCQRLLEWATAHHKKNQMVLAQSLFMLPFPVAMIVASYCSSPPRQPNCSQEAALHSNTANNKQ